MFNVQNMKFGISQTCIMDWLVDLITGVPLPKLLKFVWKKSWKYMQLIQFWLEEDLTEWFLHVFLANNILFFLLFR